MIAGPPLPILQRCAVLLTCVALLTACSGQREMLAPRSPAVPEGVDLSGQWRMQDDFEDMRQRIERAIRDTDGLDEERFMRRMANLNSGNRRPSSKTIGGLVHVFLENAERLKITQTVDGLFISFNRSIVEEYLFGEARMISVGGARAQRVSGWEGNQYVIETLGEEGMKLTERYELLDDGRRLTRQITLRSSDMDQVTIIQTYARAPG